MAIRKPLLLAGILTICAAVTFAASNDSADTATLYLQAWSFKDYSTMRQLTAPDSRGGVDEGAFFRAAAAIPAPAGTAKVVSRAPGIGGKGETIYFEYTVPGGEEPQRGSIQLTPHGVSHPQLVAAVQPSAAIPSGPNQSVSFGQTIDGESAASIMQKMQQASQAIKTLHGELQISGSMMGTNVSESAKLLYKAPDKVRLDSKSFIMNSNGTRSILYMPGSNIYLDLSGFGDLELTPGIGMSAEEMRDKYQVELLEKGEVAGQPAFKLRLQSPQQTSSLLGGLGQGNSRITLWVSAKTWLPIRATMDGMKVDYNNLQANAGEVDDSAFDFRPPQGATAFSLGGLMGSLTGAGQGLLDEN